MLIYQGVGLGIFVLFFRISTEVYLDLILSKIRFLSKKHIQNGEYDII
jgi:hypothetical protein